MSQDQADKLRDAAEGILEMAGELEAGGDAAIGGSDVERARAILHKWVDSVTGVVLTHAFGRVTLIHENGRQSAITSPDLPFIMTKPIDWKPSE